MSKVKGEGHEAKQARTQNGLQLKKGGKIAISFKCMVKEFPIGRRCRVAELDAGQFFGPDPTRPT